jgi:hypothetical protein
MRLGNAIRLALAVPALLLSGSHAAAQAGGRPEIVHVSIVFAPAERSLSAEAKSALDAAAAKMDAMCGKDWGPRSWVHASYGIPGTSWPRNDMQMIGERVEAMHRHFMQYSPRSWYLSISASEGSLDRPMPAGQDHVASVAMYCGL